MTSDHAAKVHHIMKAIRSNASAALSRVQDISSAEDMTDDQFKALAKEVEEVGELVVQLERTNPHIIPALFEVPYGKWQGWSGLENYRNTLAHEFRRVTPKDLYRWVTTKLSLGEVCDLLAAVTSVKMTTGHFSFGFESDVKKLPQTSEGDSLLAGASVIVLRLDDSGELMAARSWRNEKDDWHASVRWVQTLADEDNELTFGVRDTEFRLVPRPVASDDEERHYAYNLTTVPNLPYLWRPAKLHQMGNRLVRKKRR